MDYTVETMTSVVLTDGGCSSQNTALPFSHGYLISFSVLVETVMWRA